jgi:acetyltransferase-like isoleucine patch superfamily enzyme
VHRTSLLRLFAKARRRLQDTIWRPPRGMSVAAGTKVRGYPRIVIHDEAEISCGAGVLLTSRPEGYHAGMAFPVTLIADWPHALIRIGDGTQLFGCCIHAWKRVEIGRKCLIAAGAQILDAHGHDTNWARARARSTTQDCPEAIVLGDHCWIGLGAVVLKGARLGEGCLVAANSVVTKGRYPAFSLIAGVPAQVIHTVSPRDIEAETDGPS